MNDRLSLVNLSSDQKNGHKKIRKYNTQARNATDIVKRKKKKKLFEKAVQQCKERKVADYGYEPAPRLVGKIIESKGKNNDKKLTHKKEPAKRRKKKRKSS